MGLIVFHQFFAYPTEKSFSFCSPNRNIVSAPMFESGVLAAEEMLDRVVCSREQFSFQMCLESGDGSGTFCNWRQRVPDSWCRDTECFG